MQFNEATAELIIRNSPFWYRDGYDVCEFTIDPSAQADVKGKFNRDLSAWGYEKRYRLDEEGYYTLDE